MKNPNLMKLLFVVVLISLLPATRALATELTGKLGWAEKRSLSLPVSGVVQKVGGESGEIVRKGTLLLSLDKRPFMTALMKAKAAHVAASADVDEAAKELKRSTELYERTVLSIHELELVKIAHKKAQARLAAAQAQLNSARWALEHAEIRTKKALRIVARHINPGETVVTRFQARPLLVVAAANRMQVSVAAGADQAAILGYKGQVKVVVGKDSYNGNIRRIRQVGNGYMVEIEFGGVTAGKLWAGQSARVVFP